MTSTNTPIWPPVVAAYRRALVENPDIAQHVGTILSTDREILAAGGDTHRLHDIAAQRTLRPYRRRREWLAIRDSPYLRYGLILLLLGQAIHGYAHPDTAVNTIANCLTLVGAFQIIVALAIFIYGVITAPVRPEDGLALSFAYMLILDDQPHPEADQ